MCYWRFAAISESRNPPWLQYGLSLLCFAFALFSKTVSGSLPAALLLVLWWKRGAIRWQDVGSLAPFFALAMVLGRQTARLEVSHVLANGPEWDLTFLERLLIAGRAICFYAGKLLWPHPLIFNYPRWQIDTHVWWQFLFPAIVVLLMMLLWLFRGRIGRGALTGVLFFIGTLFPALGFFNVYPMRYSFVADHFQYLASIGIIVLICAGIARFCPGHRMFPFLPILLVLTCLSWQQGKTYKDRTTLFSDVIAKNPASWLSYTNRGRDYALSGRDDLAMADLQQSLKLNPDDADALQCRGIIFLKQKNYDHALADFDRSIVLSPWRSDYYRNRSVANHKAGRLMQALSDAGKVIELDPYDVKAYLHRALLYGLTEAYADAIRDLDAALQLDSGSFAAYANRGLIYFRQGLIDKSLSDYSRALSINSESAEIYFNRGIALAARGDADRAGLDLRQAQRLGFKVTDGEIEQVLASPRRVKK